MPHSGWHTISAVRSSSSPLPIDEATTHALQYLAENSFLVLFPVPKILPKIDSFGS